jgi:CMP-N-acetylneuraminic acid synthetase
MTVKVSIVITSHNYAKWLPKSLDSALNQSMAIEVVVVDDGSTDHTQDVLAQYRHIPNLKIVTTEGLGLASACNRGIAEAEGEYIVRLDADDWFDENLALVLSTYLDNHPTVGMVYCDYYTVDVHGEIIDTIRRVKVNDEVELLDRPCLAAGAMYRRSCYDRIGGYNESLRYQEDYDFWIKFIEKFEVRNISLPMMYYRRHGASMSRNFSARMQTRRDVKKQFVAEHRDRFSQSILAVVPARADKMGKSKLPLMPLAGESLLTRTLGKLASVDLIERIIVSTEDPEIAAEAEAAGADVPYLRSLASISPSVPFEATMIDLLTWLQKNQGYCPDIVALIHPTAPFISAEQIIEAIDTMLLYSTDSVIGVTEDLTYHWQPGKTGLSPVGYQKRVVRQEKDMIYKEVGGLYLFRTEPFLKSGELLGQTVGHIEFAAEEAIRIQSAWEYWLACKMADESGIWFK